MKKIFAFAMAIVSMAAVMTSCNNDNSEFIEQQAPAETEVQEGRAIVEFLMPVTDVQLEMMDIQINYTIDGQNHTITPQDMTEVEFPTDTKPICVTGVGEPKLLAYRLSGSYTKQQLEDATYQRIVTENADGSAKYEGQSVNVFFGFKCSLYNAAYDVQRFSFRYEFGQGFEVSAEGAKNALYKAFDNSVNPMY